MIIKSQLMNFIDSECPEFSQICRKLVKERRRKYLSLDEYLSAFSQYIISLIEKNKKIQLQGVAQLTENLIVNGNQQVKRVIISSLLENVINFCEDNKKLYPFERLSKFLGPKGQLLCIQIDGLWKEKIISN